MLLLLSVFSGDSWWLRSSALSFMSRSISHFTIVYKLNSVEQRMLLQLEA